MNAETKMVELLNEEVKMTEFLNAEVKRAEIKRDLSVAVQSERAINHQVLVLINLAEDNQCYLYDGYDDLRHWLVGEFKYSESAAARRVSAARMLRDVPEVADKILAGEVNLTTLGVARRAIHLQEGKGEKLTPQEKAGVIQEIENRSQTQAEVALIKLMPDIASEIKGDRVRVIDEDTSRLAANLPNETLEKLKRVKDLLSHALPTGTFAQVIDRVCEDWLNAKDPLRKTMKDKVRREKQVQKQEADQRQKEGGRPRKGIGVQGSERIEVRNEQQQSTASPPPTAAVKPRVNKAAEHRQVFQNSQGRCEYVSEETGKVCGATGFVQKDHIHPRALGGQDGPDNYRCLCAKHNRLMAEVILGKARARSWKTDFPSNDRHH